MNPEDYIIVNKRELEKELKDLKDIRNSGYSTKGLNYDKHYIDAKIYSIESLFSNFKPLQPLLEDTFKSARQLKRSGVISNSIQHKYADFQYFIKDKEI